MQESSIQERNIELLARAREGDESAQAELIASNMGLVRSIASRFRDRADEGHGCDFDDLMQIGTIGMIKAMHSFDPSFGTTFSTYAVPLIIGEIRRFLRDDGLIKISRTTKKQNAIILREREAFTKRHGREPTLDELSDICGMNREELVFALGSGSPAHSLNDAVGDDGAELMDLLPSSDNEIESLTDRLALKEAIRSLPPNQREIIVLRYFRELSQQQTADILGITQVKVSREEKKIFAYLRNIL
ncbi:MAG: sigma-70 family RNA polymerase sigma factor [Clostridia bacterium]|nr:sigma-70 family RNA polymerase sigma factor [Clostridia bacterium]